MVSFLKFHYMYTVQSLLFIMTLRVRANTNSPLLSASFLTCAIVSLNILNSFVSHCIVVPGKHYSKLSTVCSFLQRVKSALWLGLTFAKLD